MKQIPVLTGLRGIAAYSVLFGHAIDYAFAGRMHGHVVGPVYFGMSLFFVLSGFVITYNYSENIGSAGGIYRFFVARFARLYPLYIAMLTISLVMYPHEYFFGHPWFALSALTLTQSWFNIPGVSGEIFGQSWSISTEWGFYALFPLLSLSVSRIRRPSAALWIFVISSFTLLAVLFTFRDKAISFIGDHLSSGYPVSTPPWLWITYFGPLRCLEFIAGVLACNAYRASSRAPNLRKDNLIFGMCCLWFVIVAVVPAFTSDGPIEDMVRSFAFAPALAPAIVILCSNEKILAARIVCSKPLSVMGEISYAIYVWKFLVISILAIHGYTANPLLFIALVIVLDTAVGFLSFVLFERPMRALVRSALGTIGDRLAARWSQSRTL